jgi:hypothetical protein
VVVVVVMMVVVVVMMTSLEAETGHLLVKLYEQKKTYRPTTYSNKIMLLLYSASRDRL